MSLTCPICRTNIKVDNSSFPRKAASEHWEKNHKSWGRQGLQEKLDNQRFKVWLETLPTINHHLIKI